MLESTVVEAINSLVLLGLSLIIVLGCGEPTPVLKTGPDTPDNPGPARHREPPSRVPPDLEEPIVLECFTEPFINADPYYLGRETIRCGSGQWRVEYSLETGSGWSEGLQLPGLILLTVHPPLGGVERAIGRPRLTRFESVLTDGPSPGALAVLLAACELRSEEEYSLPARDLRQGLDYELELKTGGWSEIGTVWGERLCMEVEVLPQGYVFQLDETGWTWSVRWPGGYAERAVYEPHPGREMVTSVVEADDAEPEVVEVDEDSTGDEPESESTENGA